MIRQFNTAPTIDGSPLLLPRSATPFRLVAAWFEYTPSAGVVAPVLQIIYGGVATVVAVPGASMPAPLTHMVTFALGVSNGVYARIDGSNVQSVRMPEFSITPEMEVRIAFEDAATGDSASEVSWLLDDEPFQRFG